MRAVLAQAISDGNVRSLPDGGGEEMVALLLFLLLAAVIVLGAVTFLLVLHFVAQRRRNLNSDARLEALAPDPVAWRSGPVLLVPARWMAVKAASVREVRDALDLSNVTPCSIEDGLAGNHPQDIFLAPPVKGWVLITGPGIPDPADDIDEVFHLVRALSVRLGSAQFFSFDQSLGHHAWAWARGGGIVRGFAWIDHTAWNEGETTPAERALGVRCPSYQQPSSRHPLAREGILANVDKVPLLAARWSVDPVSVHQQLPRAIGVSGEFTRIRSS